MKKFEFTGETKTISLFFRTATLHRIRAVAEFALVKIGDLGGWIEKEENLSHEGDAWVVTMPRFGAMPRFVTMVSDRCYW